MEIFQQGVVIILGSALKFLFGPITGTAVGMHPLLTALFTATGMMLTVFVVMLGGVRLKNYLLTKFGGKKRMNKRNRMIVRVRGQYGMLGIAFLTPLVFSPPGGALIALALTSQKRKVILPMLFSALFWGLLYSYFIDTLISFLPIDVG